MTRTLSLDPIFYVYEHIRSDRGEVFYVGKGKKWRKTIMSGRKNKYHEAVRQKLKSLGFEMEVRLVRDHMTEADALAFEIERIAYWRGLGIKLTNGTDGGEGVTGMRHGPETRARMSQVRKGRKHSPEWCAKISAGNMGRTYTPETIEKMRVGQKRRADQNPEHILEMTRLANLANQTPEAIAKRSASNTGKKRSPEARARISESMRGRTYSEEARINMAIGQTGKKQSEETKAKRKATWARKREEKAAL